MMTDFFTTEFTISRHIWTGEISSVSNIGSFKGNLQQNNPELAQSYNTSFGRSFSIICPIDIDIKVGDVLTADGKDYSVEATDFKKLGNVSHLEIICELPETV